MCDMFEKRLTAFLYRPCMAAAFLLDPANFVAQSAVPFARDGRQLACASSLPVAI